MDTTHALRTAPARYAAGVDRRDADLFLSAFDPDAALWIPPRGAAGGAPRVLRGHEQLSEVIERIARYDRTFHLLGQTRLESASASEAHAETYCVAHHWLATGDRIEDTVLYIRYEDAYRLGTDGVWRLSRQQLHEDARESRNLIIGQEGMVMP